MFNIPILENLLRIDEFLNFEVPFPRFMITRSPMIYRLDPLFGTKYTLGHRCMVGQILYNTFLM